MNFYAYTDNALKYLRRFFITEFNRTAIQIRSDRLNVIPKSEKLYDRLYAETVKVLLRIARNKYKECSGTDTIEIAWLMGLLENANPITGYIFSTDKDRKRAYFAESVLSGYNLDKAKQKALRYWYQSVKQYADIVTDEAAMQAFADTNVKFVMWRTAEDEHVCSECVPRNGKVYPLEYAPKIPAHYNCRCYFVRVNRNAT